MSVALPYPAQLEFDADRHITRWRPLVQWLLAVPHLIVANTLSSLRGILTLISLFTVLFTKQIPRPLFDAIAMTYRYEWRTLSYALFLHDDYPPFDFTPTSDDDGRQPGGQLTIQYPEQLNRWKPLYKWLLAAPHYVVCLALAAASVVAVLAGGVAVVATGRYPERARRFLVSAYRYGIRVQAYVGLLTDQYPPFRLAA